MLPSQLTTKPSKVPLYKLPASLQTSDSDIVRVISMFSPLTNHSTTAASQPLAAIRILNTVGVREHKSRATSRAEDESPGQQRTSSHPGAQITRLSYSLEAFDRALSSLCRPKIF